MVPCFFCFLTPHLLFTLSILSSSIPISLSFFHTLFFSASVVLTLSSIPSLHPVSDHTPLPSLLFLWSITANRCCKLCPLATGYRSVSRMYSVSFPASTLALSLCSSRHIPLALAPVCQRSKTGCAHHSSPSSCHSGGLAGLRQIASWQIIQAQPEKSQINGPFSAVLMVLLSTWPGDSSLCGHEYQHFMRKTYL